MRYDMANRYALKTAYVHIDWDRFIARSPTSASPPRTCRARRLGGGRAAVREILTAADSVSSAERAGAIRIASGITDAADDVWREMTTTACVGPHAPRCRAVGRQWGACGAPRTIEVVLQLKVAFRYGPPLWRRAQVPAVKKISYTYDLGTCWEHDVTLEKRLPLDPEVTYPVCVAFAGDSPVEYPPVDIGEVNRRLAGDDPAV